MAHIKTAEQAAADLAELGNQIDESVRQALAIPALDAARAAANEAGIGGARRSLREAVEVFDAAQRDIRAALDAERAAREANDEAIVEAEWDLGRCFELRANKTWLILDAAGQTLKEPRAMSADEKRAWLSNEVRKTTRVIEAARALRKAEQRSAEARDNLALADRRISAAKYDLQASVALLTTLTTALGGIAS